MTCKGLHQLGWLSWAIACWPGVVRPEAGFETSTVGPNIGQGPYHMSLLFVSFPRGLVVNALSTMAALQ